MSARPLAIGIAILRHRLYDIDIIIRRTLVYSTLTLILALIYVGCIVLFQQLVVPHGGFTDPEYGSVGLTEAHARASHDIAVATVAYAEIDRAVIDGRAEGFCKLIVARDRTAC